MTPHDLTLAQEINVIRDLKIQNANKFSEQGACSTYPNRATINYELIDEQLKIWKVQQNIGEREKIEAMVKHQPPKKNSKQKCLKLCNNNNNKANDSYLTFR